MSATARKTKTEFRQVRPRPEPTGFVEEAFGRMSRLANDIGASQFGLYTTLATVGSLRLTPVVDSDFPGVSALSRRCCSPEGSDFAMGVLADLTPAFWSTALTAEAPPSRWVRPIRYPFAEEAGLALPLPVERGGGLALLCGADMTLTDEAICAAHMECLSLFAAVCRQRPAPAGDHPPISPRELQCLRLTADGLTSEEIAAELGLSVHTANQYLANTTQKLNAVNRMHAVAKALRSGLFD